MADFYREYMGRWEGQDETVFELNGAAITGRLANDPETEIEIPLNPIVRLLWRTDSGEQMFFNAHTWIRNADNRWVERIEVKPARGDVNVTLRRILDEPEWCECDRHG